ncbi:hypothetical protein V8F33_012044, partial [Rhypophila sp. PSN 637]
PSTEKEPCHQDNDSLTIILGLSPRTCANCLGEMNGISAAKAGNIRECAFIADGKFQLQKMAFENLEHGPYQEWHDRDRDVTWCLSGSQGGGSLVTSFKDSEVKLDETVKNNEIYYKPANGNDVTKTSQPLESEHEMRPNPSPAPPPHHIPSPDPPHHALDSDPTEQPTLLPVDTEEGAENGGNTPEGLDAVEGRANQDSADVQRFLTDKHESEA